VLIFTYHYLFFYKKKSTFAHRLAAIAGRRERTVMLQAISKLNN
jgi:hypothetical protein